jgi:uncharacterized protein (DUF2236 family)
LGLDVVCPYGGILMTQASTEKESTESRESRESSSPFDDPIMAIRRRMQNTIRTTLVGDEPPVRDFSQNNRTDTGLFGPDSVTWKVHQDSSMLIGGIRAILLQTMNPRAMAGVAQHSAYKEDPTGRLWRTARYVGVVSFGTTDEAMAAIAGVKRAHRPVHGRTSEGEKYSANDPDLLRWIHVALTDSFLSAYRRFGATALTSAERDTYISEQAGLATLLGASPAPTSVAEMKSYFAEHRNIGELRATSEAREAARFLMTVRLAPTTRPAYLLLAAAAIGSLPAWVRLALRLPILPVTDRVAVRPAVTLLNRTIGWALSAPLP